MKPMKFLRALAALALAASAGFACAECSEGEYVCVDGPGTKFIDGVEVFRECWNYQYEKTCSFDEEEDYCAALAAEPKCSIISRQCKSYDLTGTCLGFVSIYSCGERLPESADYVEIDFSYTLADGQDVSQCQSFLDNTDCYVASTTCLEPGETRIINGVAVYKDCWREERHYACRSEGVSNSCLTLEAAPGCTPVGDPVCAKETEAGCDYYTAIYQCVNEGDLSGEDITPSGPGVSDSFDSLACENATAGMTCTLESSTCTEEGGTKIINGVEVTASCWEETQTYTCKETVEELNCSALENLAECTEQSSVCIDKEGFKCHAYEKQFLCSGDKPVDGGAADKITESVNVSGIIWSETCSPLEENPDCEVASTVCTEPGGVKEINGELVEKDCWAYETVYVCGNRTESGATSNCSALETNPKCVLTESVCLSSAADGSCLTTAHTYRCEEREETSVTEVFCRPIECLNGICDDPDPADKDFSWVIAMLEVAREGSVYGDIDGNEFFKGSADKCTKKVLGFSCCDTKVQAGAANSEAFGKMLVFTGEATAEAIKYVGSPYVYDVLSASDSTSGLLNMLYGNASSGVYNPSLSFYGFSMSMQGGTMYFTFNPGVFAFTVAAQIAMDFLQCTTDEQALMLKKGQDLCHFVGTYCSKEAIGCIERSQSYCCYNSKLARIIQEQGRQQTGKSWGTAKNPDCSGFTIEELGSLDFERMDLGEFEADIRKQAELNIEAAQDRGTSHVNRLVEDGLGGYISPDAGTSGAVNPNYTGNLPASRRK